MPFDSEPLRLRHAKLEEKTSETFMDNHSRTIMAINGYTPPPGILRLVYVTKRGERKYAHIPFPDQYREAQIAALETLGAYMTVQVFKDVQLQGVSRDRNGEWVSSVIRPQDWSRVVPTCFCEVRVVDGAVESLENPFRHGHLWLTAGKLVEGRMKWTGVERRVHPASTAYNAPPKGEPVTPWLNSPTSYQNAISLLGPVMAGNTAAGLSLSPASQSYPYKREVPTTGFKFVAFPDPENMSEWVPFPEAAYKDEEVWKDVVPLPNELLGVMIQK